jgi:ABC-2 type transport system permease protein
VAEQDMGELVQDDLVPMRRARASLMQDEVGIGYSTHSPRYRRVLASVSHGLPAPTLAQPAVLRAVVLTGAGLALTGLLGLGLGTILRHSPAALGVFVAGAFLAGQFTLAFAPSAASYIPLGIVANSLAAVTPKQGALSPCAGLGILTIYAAATLGAGGWLLTRRVA